MKTSSPILAVLLFGLAAGTAFASAAAQARQDDWAAEKCARYSAAWTEAKARFSMDGVSPEFIARHDAFIASDCKTEADVCPRSARELDIANIMVIAAMNAGMASTFPPFACR